MLMKKALRKSLWNQIFSEKRKERQIMKLLPEEFSRRMAAFMGDEFQSFAYSCISGDRKNALRVTELKTTAKQFCEIGRAHV